MNEPLKLGENQYVFRKPKNIRAITITLLLIAALIILGFSSPFIFFGLSIKEYPANYIILMPALMFFPLIILAIPSVISANQEATLDKDKLTIHLKSGEQTLDISKVKGIKHNLLKMTTRLYTNEYYYDISKYLKGYEDLYRLILSKCEINPIKTGLKTKTSLNYFTVSIIMTYMMGIFSSFLIFPLIAEFGVLKGSLFFIGGNVVLCGFCFLVAFEQYAKYQFDNDSFTVFTPFKSKKYSYRAINKITLDKGRSMLILKIKHSQKKIYVPIGLSLEDVYIYLTEKTDVIKPQKTSLLGLYPHETKLNIGI